MASAPLRPSRPNTIPTPNIGIGTLATGGFSAANVSVIAPGPAPENSIVNPMQKFAQLILYGIAMIAIWGGILSIAFSDESTNLNFIILGAGGLVSAFMAIADLGDSCLPGLGTLMPAVSPK